MTRKRTTPPFDGYAFKSWWGSVGWAVAKAELEKRTKREHGLQSTNDGRRRKAERDYQIYRDTADRLIAGDPQLRSATRNRLAKEVQAELRKHGRGVVSARTIWGALWPKNKV